MVKRTTAKGGVVLTVHVSVLGNPNNSTDVSKHDVAQTANSTIKAVIDSSDRNGAMQIMAESASRLAGEP